VDYPSSKLSFALVDYHVGPPMDQWADGAVRQFLEDAIEIGSENILIRHNAASSPEPQPGTVHGVIESLRRRESTS